MNKTVPGYQGYPYPYPGCFNKPVPGTRVFCRVHIELTKGSGTGMDVLPSSPKGSGMVGLLVPVPVPDLGYFNRVVPGTRVFSSGSTELTKVSGTGIEGVPNLPKCQVRA